LGLESSVHLAGKEKIAALRLLKECNEAKFALMEKGPSVLSVKTMEEKLKLAIRLLNWYIYMELT
jgi:hypothetical protein